MVSYKLICTRCGRSFLAPISMLRRKMCYHCHPPHSLKHRHLQEYLREASEPLRREPPECEAVWPARDAERKRRRQLLYDTPGYAWSIHDDQLARSAIAEAKGEDGGGGKDG